MRVSTICLYETAFFFTLPSLRLRLKPSGAGAPRASRADAVSEVHVIAGTSRRNTLAAPSACVLSERAQGFLQGQLTDCSQRPASHPHPIILGFGVHSCVCCGRGCFHTLRWGLFSYPELVLVARLWPFPSPFTPVAFAFAVWRAERPGGVSHRGDFTAAPLW